MLEKFCMGCMNDTGGVELCPHCGWHRETESVSQSALYLPPRTVLVERYMLGRVLGQGGFAITYLAWDTYLNIKVAIKEHFPQQYVSRNVGQTTVAVYSAEGRELFPYSLEKFVEEARAISKFDDHPNIVSVRDIFKANNTGYMVMNFVEGLNMKQYLDANDGRLTFDVTLKIITPVMDALREVHSVNMLHRDVSPDNIYISRNGQIKLLDFGAARHAIGEQSKSLAMVLKAGYAPWEQYQEKGKQGPWTDIYGLGATIYRALTGKLIPQATDRIEEDSVKPPSALGVSIPGPAEVALMKALAVRANQRYQSMEEFQENFNAGYVNVNCPHCASVNQLGVDVSLEQTTCNTCHQLLKPPDTMSSCPHCGVTNRIAGGMAVEKTKCQSCRKLMVVKDEAIGGWKTQIKKFIVPFAVASVLVIGGVTMMSAHSSEQAVVLANGGVYVGETWWGKPSGKGKATLSDGKVYEGQFKGSKFNGQGTLTYSDKTKYIGDFVDDMRQGKGKLLDSQGYAIYEGDWNNDKKHGKGKLMNDQKQIIYDGDWVNDEQHGKGTMVLESGTTYVGDFVTGKLTGKGKFVMRNGDEYDGEVIDGKFQGAGVYKSKNSGWVYTGSFNNDKRHGNGTLEWQDGKKYIGEFKEGVISGQGKLIWPDGRVDEGNWENGRFAG